MSDERTGLSVGFPGVCLFSARVVVVMALLAVCSGAAAEMNFVVESESMLPVAYDVDVLVVGGSLAGVQAACAAAGDGASVVLIEDRPYLGYDLCATQRLWLESDEKPSTPLTRAIFGSKQVATPMQVKNALDKALLDAGVEFLTGCYAVDTAPGGVVMVNRSGRQVIVAKVIIDATGRGAITRSTGAAFRADASGPEEFKYVVVGGQAVDKASPRKLPVVYKSGNNEYPVYEYTVKMKRSGAGFRPLNDIFHKTRSLTWTTGALDLSERLFHIPQDSIVSSGTCGEAWPGAERISLDLFRPAKVKCWYVLNAYADIPSRHAARALRPSQFAVIGQRIGRAAAGEARSAKARPPIDGARKKAKPGPLSIKRPGGKTRFGDRKKIKLGARALPVLGRFDVVVVGGGTSGAPAAIAAGRNGASTLVVEYLDELGGVGTAGMIAKYWYGYRRVKGKELALGYVSPKQIRAGVASGILRNGYAGEVGEKFGGSWKPLAKAEWLRQQVLTAGGEVWFNCFGCGVVVEGTKVRGVVLAGPFGQGVVLAKTVIDSTGNADIAAAAGAKTRYGVSKRGDLSVQVAGYPRRNLEDKYVNTAYTMVDDTDVLDRGHLLLWGRSRQAKYYDMGQLIDSRERRRVVGEFFLQTRDILNARRYPDTICHHLSNFDAGAFPTTDILLIKDMKGPAYVCDLPYRCIIPKGVEGLLVTGLGASADRDAMTLVRMQPDLENQGYAAGVAAAMAAEANADVRKINIKTLQKKLIEKGIAQPRVLKDTDSHPLGDKRLKDAVAELKNLKIEINQRRDSHNSAYSALGAVMSHPNRSIPLLTRAYLAEKDPSRKLNYALVLGVLGSNAGSETLLKALGDNPTWDKGYNMSSKRETANTFSKVDRLVIALGLTRSPKALPALLDKLKMLKADSALSHVKAICIALRANRGVALARPLADLLDKPGMSGHSQAADYHRSSSPQTKPRTITQRATTGGLLNAKFRELLIAGLLLDCGDLNGKARTILEAYKKDIQGHFASYARAAMDGELTR
jgi:flavin-dependent dehydrogenase